MDIYDEVVCVQMNCKDGALNENTEKIISFLQKIRNEKAHGVLAVFPEMALFGYDRLEQLKDISQKDIDFCLNAIASYCSELKIQAVIGGPYIYSDKQNKKIVENAVYFISTEGEAHHIYSKAHLIASEKEYFEPNQSFAICKTALGKTGFLICWDSAFCEMGRFYGLSKVDAIIVIAAWEAPYLHQWRLAVEGRSFDNSVPVIAVNRVGDSGKNNYFGHSIITDRMGNVVAENTSGKEGFISARINGLKNSKELESFGSPIAEIMN